MTGTDEPACAFPLVSAELVGENMVTGKWYIVTKRSKDGTFRVGDHISLNTDGSINCREAQGWVDALDVPQAMVGVEYVVDTKWLEKRKAKLQKELDQLSSED